MPDRLTDEERIRGIEVLDSIAFGLNEAAVRLEQAGAGAAAGMLERAATEIAAACWVLHAPVREKGPPARSADGHRCPCSPEPDDRP